MSININNDNVILNGSSDGTGSVAETVAGQEEIYLEKNEEKLRAILISEDPSTYMQQEAACVDCCFLTDGPEKNRGGER